MGAYLGPRGERIGGNGGGGFKGTRKCWIDYVSLKITSHLAALLTSALFYSFLVLI
jgi:hypothetical protein